MKTEKYTEAEMEKQLTQKQIKEIILKELPAIFKKDKKIREYILQISKDRYADKEKTEDRIDRILDELRRDREKQEKKWEAHEKAEEKKWAAQEKKWAEQVEKWKAHQEAEDKKWAEQVEKWKSHEASEEKKWATQEEKWKIHQEAEDKKWAAQEEKWKAHQEAEDKKWAAQEEKWKSHQEAEEKKWAAQEEKWKENRENTKAWEKKWEENQKVINEMLDSIKQMNKKHESSIGALGARWGLHSEAAFRNGLKAILEESFGVKVENYLDFDHEGMIFGRPDQVELDVIIHNGLTILCELKSSMSKPQVYTFWRKKEFYEKTHKRSVSRMLIISPMIDDNAVSYAKDLGMEVCTYAGDAAFPKQT